MTFSFKQKSQDFHVYEQLPFALSGQGDAFYVYIEKRNSTTQDIIDHLRKTFGISRKTIGIAGLKDKKAIARQWISIYDRALKELGGEQAFLEALAEVSRILEVGRHEFPLNLSTPIKNSFHITFRAQKKLSQEEKTTAKALVQGLLDKGYANVYGEQRFGIRGRNATQGWKIAHGKSQELRSLKKSEAIFKLQAYASKIFNEYAERIQNVGKRLLDGDILTWEEKHEQYFGIYNEEKNTVLPVQVKGVNQEATFTPLGSGAVIAYDEKTMISTGPVLGRNMPMPDPESPSGNREQKFLKRNKIDESIFKTYKQYTVFGLRRALWVQPTNTHIHYQGDDMHIDFTLPSGSYASIVFDELNYQLHKIH